MSYYVVTKNPPIATQIKNFQNKRSGKVTEARRDIQHRFACLDWKDQKKILKLFLESGFTDRDWAYSKLLRIWDDSFTEKVKTLWDQYHEDKCSWVIIRHLPKEFLLERMHELDYDRNYYFICRRLYNSSDWKIDKGRLSILDCLSLTEEMQTSMDDSEALDYLFMLVHDMCVGGLTLEQVKYLTRGCVFCATSFSPIKTALYHLYGIGCLQATAEFEKWNEIIQLRIFESKEFKEINQTPMDDRTYQCRISGLGLEYIYTSLDEKYKKADDPPIEVMRNPFPYYAIAPKEDSEDLPF